MTAKEKADEIIEKVANIENNNNDFAVDLKMASIVVDEILEVIIFNKYDDKYWEEEEYWQEVKREIELL